MHSSHEPAVSRTRRSNGPRLDGRVLGPALVVSALIHLLVLHMVSVEVDSEPRQFSAPPSRLLDIQVMHAYDIAPVTEEVASIELQIRERELVRDVPAPPALPQAPSTLDRRLETDIANRVDPGASVRDRLQYRMGAPDVWRPAPRLPARALSPEESVNTRVASQLQQYNDSMSAEAAARARAQDMTYTDGNGGRWGVTPDAIHLGTITVPLPFDVKFSPPPGKRDEVNGRLQNFAELRDQAARAETRSVFEDRARAIRARADAARAHAAAAAAAAQGKPPGGGAAPPAGGPTTTGGTAGGGVSNGGGGGG